MTARSFSIAGDGALDDLAFEGLVLAAERFVEERREIVAGRKCETIKNKKLKKTKNKRSEQYPRGLVVGQVKGRVVVRNLADGRQ